MGWTWKTVLFVINNALGGVLTGLTLKYSGGIKKGFAVILALVKLAIF